MLGQSTDNLLELRNTDRRRIHNLKYYTWVEQQGKTYEEIQAQWYQPDYWTSVQRRFGDRCSDRGVQREGGVVGGARATPSGSISQPIQPYR